MNVLAIDCSSESLLVCLGLGVGVAGGSRLPKHPYKEAGGHGARPGTVSVRIAAGFRHAERVMGAIDFCLAEAGLGKEALDLLACGSGPGSFTGLRIAMATVKGMAMGLGKPFVAVPTLDAIARSWEGAAPVLVPVIDAKRSRFYYGVYRSGESPLGPFDEELPSLLGRIAGCPEVLVVGPDAELLDDLGSERSGIRTARYGDADFGPALAALACERFASRGADPDAASPLYLRASDAEEAAMGGSA